MKEEALKLADESLNSEGLGYAETWNLCIKQARMIRRLVEELDKPHPKCDKACMYLCQTKPLSDDEIEKLYEESYLPIGSQEWEFDCVVFARAIEERHGIK